MSGDGLLKLFRATGNRAYLELIRDIAHAPPQCLSREDRPMPAVRKGKPPKNLPLGWNALLNRPTIVLAPGETKTFVFTGDETPREIR